MPIAKYDRFFGGKKGGAAEAMRAMVKQYGPTKGRQIFYATMNKKKKGR